MTKKRFCKLMMARGHDRNGAARIAGQVADVGSYAEYFAVREQALPALKDVCRYLGEQIRAAADAIAAQLAPAVEYAVETINEFCESVQSIDFSRLKRELRKRGVYD